MSDEAEPQKPAVEILLHQYQTLPHDFAGEDDACRQNEGMQRVEKANRDSKAEDVVRQCTDASTDSMCSFDVIESCLQKLDNDDAISMYELAWHCLNGSVSDESVHQLADNAVFKTQLDELARNYALGFAEPDNDYEAFLLFKLVEDQNDPDVLCALARAYQFGWGVEKNVPKAIEYYAKAADAGSFEAMQRLYDCKDKNVDEQLKDAFQHFQQQAAAGNANAQFAVAFCYYYEVGVDQNCCLAMEMCQTAENQQNSNMVVLLGWIYRQGNCVGANHIKAFELIKQAADAGNKEGQFRLGWCYQAEFGVARDYEQAMLWHEKAAMQGHANAASMLGIGYYFGDGVRKDLCKTFQCYKQAAIAGSKYGQDSTGNCYKNGTIVQQSFKQAAYWYQKAANQGYASATRDLDYCLEQLDETRDASNSITQTVLKTKATQSANPNQQYTIGFHLAKLAAQRGCGRAYFCLGDCYFNGIGTAIDINTAAKCYECVDLSNSQKYLNLVKCLETGEVENKNEIDLMSELNQANTALRNEINEFLFQMQ